ncbi:PqqD family protein [Abyssisolibacter fermentans]|uniref:PqqD family protein n=1 Tax=Abyssisolibacter fermentans TaxID=1766203 RepID=UPI000830CFCE|nr:PqqD family protein [Abyssisolibacter fermentans]
MDKKIYDILSNRIPEPLRFKIRKEGQYYLVKPLRKSCIISLNELAAYILMKIDGRTTTATILRKVNNKYKGVDEEKINMDVFVSLRELEINHLINFTNI